MCSGNRIKDIRKKRGLSAEKLGKMVGVDKTTILRYEKEEIGKIPYFTFIKIFIALETTPEEVFSEKDLELIRKSDELRGFYSSIGTKQMEIVRKLKDLPPGEVSYVSGIVQGLLAPHQE